MTLKNVRIFLVFFLALLPITACDPNLTLSSPSSGDKKVNLTWTSSTSYTNYKIQYGTTTGLYSSVIDVGLTNQYTVTNLTNGTKYYFVVVGYTQTGSGMSNEVNATPLNEVSASLTTSTLYVKKVEYNVSGQVTKMEYGNGDVTIYTYNSLNLRLTRIYTTNVNSQVLQDLNYTYDSVGNILSITDNINSADQTFEYDALNRLTKAMGQTYGTKNYVYDKIGNIVQKDGLYYSYAENGAGPHAVTSLSDGTNFKYDVNGNMIEKSKSGAITQYKYDAENRLKHVYKNQQLEVQYDYDGDGGGTKKVIATADSMIDVSSPSWFGTTPPPVGWDEPVVNLYGKETKYVGNLYEETEGVKTSYIFLGDTRIASISGGQTLYYHGDHLGGTNVLADSTGSLKELIEYEPFGQFSRHEKYGSSAEVANFYFTGKKLDDESGLFYYGARYYDPKLGRFITADTIVQNPTDPQTLNRYSYVSNNPINRIDPTGHSWKKFWKKFGDFISPLGRAIVTGDWKNFGWQLLNIATMVLAPNPWIFASGALAYTSRGLSNVGEGWSNSLSQATGYASIVAGVIGAGVEIAKQYNSFKNTTGEFYQVNQANPQASKAIAEAEILKQYGEKGANIFVNGINMDLNEALKMAANHSADILFYNPTSGAYADLFESTLGTLMPTQGGMSSRLGKLLTQMRVDLVGYSQGTIIASNAMAYAGLNGGAVTGSRFIPFGKAVGMGRIGMSAKMAGMTVVYGQGETKIFDVIRLVSSELNPFGYLQGAVGLFSGVGFSQHTSY